MLIITTNLSVEEMKTAKRIDYQRINDRILYMCTPVKMTGDNLRIKKRKNKYRDTAKLLKEDDENGETI